MGAAGTSRLRHMLFELRPVKGSSHWVRLRHAASGRQMVMTAPEASEGAWTIQLTHDALHPSDDSDRFCIERRALFSASSQGCARLHRLTSRHRLAPLFASCAPFAFISDV